MKWVLISAIIAGTLLMMIAVILSYIVVGILSATGTSGDQASTEAMQNAIEAFTSVPRDVLPFATALAGFAGGIVKSYEP
jgi:hypothetical protein